MTSDESYMKRALRLAKKGVRWTSPNPMVGAVIVKNDTIIGEGYHRKFGGSHGEINAIESASEPVEGATLYVTLEPCSHHGKTPPCVDRIIDVKPGRVVVAVTDPNPVVSGRGIAKLRDSGIDVTVGVLEEECRSLNEKFFTFMETGAPFITLKYAQTLDGRIATKTGHSKWISSEQSRRFVHGLRATHDGILVGIGTVLSDDPELTVRMVRGRNPVRIIVDSRLEIPLDARVLRDQHVAPTVIATTAVADDTKKSKLAAMGVEVTVVSATAEGRVDLTALFGDLGRRGISSVFVEGGAGIITTLIREKLPHRMVVITAPRIIGKGIEAIGDLGIDSMDDSIQLTVTRVFRKGDDIICVASFVT